MGPGERARGRTSLVDRIERDNHYIENWSLTLDLMIVVMTCAAVRSSREPVPLRNEAGVAVAPLVVGDRPPEIRFEDHPRGRVLGARSGGGGREEVAQEIAVDSSHPDCLLEGQSIFSACRRLGRGAPKPALPGRVRANQGLALARYRQEQRGAKGRVSTTRVLGRIDGHERRER